MRLSDLRAVYRCDACGDAEDHARPATVADLVAVLEAEGVGETIWWCEEHVALGGPKRCEVGASIAPDVCHMVSRRMIDIPGIDSTCSGLIHRQDRTVISSEAIEAALEHTRQLNFWEGINDPVWDESEIRKITEAAIRAFIKAQYILPEAIEAAAIALGGVLLIPDPTNTETTTLIMDAVEAAIRAFITVQYGIEANATD